MRRDDEMVEKCGAYAAGIIVAVALMLFAVGIVGWLTEGDIRQ